MVSNSSGKYRNALIQKYRNTEIQKYRNTEIQKYREIQRNIEIQRNTEIQTERKRKAFKESSPRERGFISQRLSEMIFSESKITSDFSLSKYWKICIEMNADTNMNSVSCDFTWTVSAIVINGDMSTRHVLELHNLTTKIFSEWLYVSLISEWLYVNLIKKQTV